MSVTLTDIREARDRIADAIIQTPCLESTSLSDLCRASIFPKREYLQRTGSFKERGAANALIKLAEPDRARGVIAASAGNHALALAYHGRRLDIPVTVVMPRHAPLIKRSRCARLGAEIVLHGDNIADAKLRADELAAARGLTYIHGFDAADVIAGAGTIGLEVVEDVPDVDAIVVPVGGGGLLAGICVAVKSLMPRVKIIGVEPERAASLAASINAGRPTRFPVQPTLGDGLAVPQVGDRAFALIKPHLDRLVTVGEDDLALAILRLVELEKGVVEGAGAAPLAAFLAGKLDDLKGQRVAILLCGGNIDPAILSRVIEVGLVADGRLTQFTAEITDRPGGLADLASAIASAGASVKQVEHERAFGGADISTVQVLCTVETRDAAHIDELHAHLRDRGINVIVRTSPMHCRL
jgi:threonine dehydratase